MVDPLFIDRYPPDGPIDAKAYIAAGPPWHGAIFKLTQGLTYNYRTWAALQRQPFLDHERYGVDLFDAFYHYFDLSQDGGKQAECFWTQMALIGCEQIGTLWATVDIERGGQRVPITRARVEDGISAFAERYTHLSGRKATLYSGEVLRAIGATGLYGCGRSWIALYGRELHGAGESTSQFLARTGTDLKHLAFWQYDGGRDENAPDPVGYPTTAPGCGKSDISALVLPGGLETLRRTLWAEHPEPGEPDPLPPPPTAA